MTDETITDTDEPTRPVLSGDTLDAARDLAADALPALLADATRRFDPDDSPQLLLLDLRRACDLLDLLGWPEDGPPEEEGYEAELMDPDDRDLLRRFAYAAMARGPGFHVEGQAVLDVLGWAYEPLDG
jgi:hypothetical protein